MRVLLTAQYGPLTRSEDWQSTGFETLDDIFGVVSAPTWEGRTDFKYKAAPELIAAYTSRGDDALWVEHDLPERS